MNQIAQRCWLSFLLLVYVALLLWLTTELGPTARLVSEKVVVVTLALIAIQFVVDLVPSISAKIADFAQLRIRSVEQLRTEAVKQSMTKTRPAGHNGRMLSDVLWFCSAPVMIYVIGFMTAAPLYTLIFLRWHSGETWRTSVLLAAAMGGFMFGVFGWMLDVTFDEGRLWPWLNG